PRVALCCSARHALLQPARHALLPCVSRPAAASASRPTAASASPSAALRVAPCCSQHVAPYCSQRVAPCCRSRRALLQPARRALLQPARRALLPCASRPAAASASRLAAARASPSAALRVAPCCPAQRAPCCPIHRAPCPAEPRRPARAALPNPSCATLPRSPAALGRPAATTATAAAGGGAAGSAAGAGGAGGATGSAGGAAGARGAGPTTDHHCLSWPLSQQLQRLGVDSGSHCLSQTTPPLSSFANGFFNEPVQVVEALVFYVLHRGGSRVSKRPSPRSQVAGSSQVSASGQLAASCSCRVLSHQTLLWHHCLGHPSLPHLSSMHSRLLVYGLPRSLPSLPRSPAPPCLPCIKGRQYAAPHSSKLPLTTAPLQTLHMEVLGPAPVGGTDLECYFLLAVKQLHTLHHCRPLAAQDFPVLRLHSDRGSEFSSDLLAEFCQDEGIRQLFTLPASPQQNGIETSPTLRRTGKVGDASVFRVWGALSLVCDAKSSKLSSRTLRCVFLGFPTDALPLQFYHPCKCRVFSSQDVTFNESVCFYRLHPHASHPVSLAPLFLVPVPTPLRGVTPPLTTRWLLAALHAWRPPLVFRRPSSPPPQPATVDSGAKTAGAEPRGAETRGEGSRGVATGGAATRGAGSGGAATGGAGSWGAATGGADSGGPASPSGGGAVGDPA
ncbi:unnamed protein product, partial [Closterium sp. NIES-54]